MTRGRRMAAGLYAAMKRRVPAYRRFLQEKGVRATTGFASLPLTDKDTYLRTYPLPDLCWDGALNTQQATISATSGSTGEPFYFPRTAEQDLQYAAVAEMYLRTNFSVHKKTTLYIVGWGMGIWIGGVFSYAAVRIVAERGKYPISIITPGTNQDEILKALVKLGPLYDQVIIGGYPPMIKDLIDEGNRRRIPWKRYHVKFIFSAEGFSETFRDYVIRHAGLPQTLTDTLNHYGTVDLGTMAHETPVSVLIRRIAADKPELNTALFGQHHRQPTLAQYIPELFYFEQHDGRVICSARSGLPLLRYDLKDTGGVMTFAQIRSICKKHGVDLPQEIIRAHIEATVWNVPFVYVFERSDFTVKLSGANIFPQEVRRALEHETVAAFVTGKCTLEVDVDTHMDQFLCVHVELKKSVRARSALSRLIRDRIVAALLLSNSEYAYLSKNLPAERTRPHVKLWPFADTRFFGVSGKHRWVRK